MPQAVSSALWAFATLKVLHEPLLCSMAGVVVSKIHEFGHQALCNTAWALATFGFANNPLVVAIAHRGCLIVNEFQPQGLMNLAWSFATWSVADEALLDAIAEQANRRVTAQIESGGESFWAKDPREAIVCVLGLAESFSTFDSPREDFLAVAQDAIQEWANMLDLHDHSKQTSKEEGVPTFVQRQQTKDDATPYVIEEFRHVAVVWKPAGWTVSVKERLLGGVLRAREAEFPRAEENGKPIQEWLAGQFGQSYPITLDINRAHGIVHRLDRLTSGPILCAKTEQGFYAAKLEFATRRAKKRYVCLCEGWLEILESKLIDVPLRLVWDWGSGLSSSKPDLGGQRARTLILESAHLRCPSGSKWSLVSVELQTGRHHQVRAHMSSQGHPLVGDPVYGGAEVPWCPRIFLHSYSLALDLRLRQGMDRQNLLESIKAFSSLPTDLKSALRQLEPVDDPSKVILKRWLEDPVE